MQSIECRPCISGLLEWLRAGYLISIEKLYYLDYDRPHSIGKFTEFYDAIPAVLRAYAWIMPIGADGLQESQK